MMRPGTGPMPVWLKATTVMASLVLFVPGLMIALGSVCVLLLAASDRTAEAVNLGLGSLLLTALTFGAGGVTLWNAMRSLQGKPSTPLRLPQAWMLAGLFGLSVVVAVFIRQSGFAAGLIFPPLLMVAAALPSLLAVAWFRTDLDADGLSWRRGLVAFAGGATVSTVLVLLLGLLPTFLLAVALNWGDAAMRYLQTLLVDLAGDRIGQALASRGFVIVFIQLAILAPLVEEIAKPLVTLPLIGRLARRDAFLVAALAGAGFAALENVLYASAGGRAWAGILLVRATGAAIHPLGAGLVGLSLRDLLNGEREAFQHGLKRFGIAVGMHALWNGGSLLVITLSGAQFIGARPPAINILGQSLAGINLALLVVLGLAALWIGRAVASGLRLPWEREAESMPDAPFILSNRAAALWALACFAAILPAAVAALQMLLR